MELSLTEAIDQLDFPLKEKSVGKDNCSPSLMTTPVESALSASSLHPQYQVSTSFPDGRGDITLLTVDGVVFHVHRAVLQYSSSVFEAIFEAGGVKDEEGLVIKEQLKIEADAATLDVLLRHVYQNRSSPIIEDVDLLASVLRAAKRYEMEGVSDQLRRSVLETRIVRQKIVPPLYTRFPFAVLVITHAFEFYEEAQLALRECMKGDLKTYMKGASNIDVPVSLMHTILRLREKRAGWFRSKLDVIPWPPTSCVYCYRKHGEWRCHLEREVLFELDFEVMKRKLETSEMCASSHEIAKLVPANTLSSWVGEWKVMQESLPPLLEESSK